MVPQATIGANATLRGNNTATLRKGHAAAAEAAPRVFARDWPKDRLLRLRACSETARMMPRALLKTCR